MTRMWHLWLHEGGFKKELHMCGPCGRQRGLDRTLIVVAAKDDAFSHHYDSFGGGTIRVVSTYEGGHPSKAFIDAYRAHPDYTSYLFVQDSCAGIVDDVVEPFRGRGEVVAWASFPFFYDNEEQAVWVNDQYPGQEAPQKGIFGPIFYASREAMETVEPYFPETPPDKLMAQGTERAWAVAFKKVGIEVEALYDHDRGQMQEGLCPPFRKVFADRQ